MEHIRRADILDFRSRLLRVVSPSTANNVIGLLKIAYREGIYREELDRNPSEGVGLVRYEKKKLGIFTVKELQGLFPKDGFGPWEDLQSYTCFFVAASCGLRRGEILMLRWVNIDFKQGILQVRRAWKDVNEEGPPKWNQIRDVPLPDRTALCLKEWRKNTSHVLPDSLVFCYWDGKRLGNTWWAKHWNQAMKKFVSPKDVLEKLPISRSSLYRRIRDKTIL